jgi:hypothetical protein
MKNRSDWYALTRFGQLSVFNAEKIITPGEVKDQKFSIDLSNSGFSGARVFAITIQNSNYNLKYILCLLNSNLMKMFLQSISSLKNGGYYSYSSNILNKVPIKIISFEKQISFIERANIITNLNANLQSKLSKFLSRIESNFNVEIITGKLEKFYDYDFKTFAEELKKQKVVISLIDQDEWEDYFLSYKKEINDLQAEIAKTDKEIDQMVYELYGLTVEEIKVVEGA